jgi:4'-phosphopantetheinyl transferase
VPSAVPSSALVVAAAGVSVWLADLDGPHDHQAAFELLSEDERTRARRFVFDGHRRRFVACRALLRTLLADRIGGRAPDVRFEYGPVGKPALAGGTADGLHFNVSHSDRQALLAFSEGRAIGIDLQQMRPVSDIDRLAATVFSGAERDALARVPPDAQLQAFYNGWTRKEAYIKARGEGLGRLRAIDVALTPGEPARLLGVDGDPSEAARWSLEALSVLPGFAAALCVAAV